MVDLRCIRSFIQVVESGSFAKAARRLDLSCAAVSRHVSSLEEAVGGRLLNRTTRKLRLTEAGEASFESYSRILRELEVVHQNARAGTSSPQGTLRVSSASFFWIWRIAPVLPEFLSRYPKLRVQVSLTERVVDLVEEGYDLAIQILAPQAKSLVVRKIVPLYRAIYASAGYLRTHGQPRHPDDLKNHNCLLYAHYAEEVEWEFMRRNETFRVIVDGNLRSTDVNTLRLAAMQGIGIARGVTFLVHADLEAGRLVRVLPDYDVVPLDLWAVYPSRQQLPAKVRVFIDFLEEKFAGDPTLTQPMQAQPRRLGRR